MDFSTSAISLIVPVATIFMVFVTKRVVPSLLLGIFLGGLMFSLSKGILGLGLVVHSLTYTFKAIIGVFYSSEGIELDAVYIFAFLVILGVLTQIISSAGGITAFVNLAKRRIKTAVGAELLAFTAGIIIFVDDYFNALTVGQISRGLSDANQSTRERLAYIIDSTSAPVCVLVPLSSWGAYTLGLFGKNIPEKYGDSLYLLLSSILTNFYGWLSILAVFLTIIWQVNFKTMRKHVNVGVKDLYLQKEGVTAAQMPSEVFLTHQDVMTQEVIEVQEVQEIREIRENSKSIANAATPSAYLLILPISSLIISISLMIFLTGYLNSGDINPLHALKESDTSLSLFAGGIFSLAFAFLLSLRFIKLNKYLAIVKNGFLSMLPAISILVLAWAIGPVIKNDMQTGLYLANLSKNFLEGYALALMPVVLFIISCFISFCTGTSWGTFAIMIPLSVEVIEASGGNLILSLSAILAGSVFGDHASPISDTTILSATGAGCSVRSHFITQLPYALLAAGASIAAFSIASLYSTPLAFIVGITVVSLTLYFNKSK